MSSEIEQDKDHLVCAYTWRFVWIFFTVKDKLETFYGKKESRSGERVETGEPTPIVRRLLFAILS